jgi:lipid-A-disaccharide synthase
MCAYIECVLALFPFEPEAYRRLSGPRCVYVGHPLLERKLTYKTQELEKAKNAFIIMPGSRVAEIKRMAPIYGGVVDLLKSEIKDLDIVLPVAPNMELLLLEEIKKWTVAPRLISQGEKSAYFEKARLALVTSGLATLELALSQVPMVVAYKVSFIEYFFRFLIKVNSIVLPNLIVEKNFIPEFIQDRATAKNLAQAVKELLVDEEKRRQQILMFVRVHEALSLSGAKPSDRAAEVIMEYLR